MRALQTLQEKFGKPHPALEGYREPHYSQSWLVGAFFRLNRRRTSNGFSINPIPYDDMKFMADEIYHLSGHMRELFFLVMEYTDEVVMKELDSKGKPSDDSR